ncbi:hypothetical protein TrVE_jg9372 [Triparma verrucosa]|uniref:Uncharacterized protein n=1 Tax=Triparma verrucosa TaxID=1606542 RepID=A0A9W7DN79_9STRA|nr:hypothetical protein TrVE_jg9372 [Triparma verrucosa]
MLSAQKIDRTTVLAVGWTGFATSFGTTISEIYASLKRQKCKLELTESGEVDRVSEIEQPVGECSWVYLREAVGKCSPQELSEFLCQTILIKGIEIFESVRSQRTFTTSAIDKDTIVFAVI